ncbi:MAG TPA: hypothetical protein VE961_01675 [Pyrinomonadaceae bacterium]|nr:hypothetical protein [Pyrinomonadaceae bacterium]
MKKAILSCLLLSLVCVAISGQQKPESPDAKCTLSLDRSPDLRGLRLGMTQAAVLARFPGVTIEKPNKFGLARLRLLVVDMSALTRAGARDKGVQTDMTAGEADGSSFVLDSARFPALKGVRRMQLRFIDGRLSYLDVAYDDGIKWESVDQFVDTIAEALKLPKDWQTPEDSDGGDQEKELRCEGFVISANTSGDATDSHAGPELILQDVAAWNAMSKKQNDLIDKAKRDEEAKRKSFKP